MSQPEFQFVTGEDPQMILAPGLRLIFFRAGDRWAHFLDVGDANVVQDVPTGIAATVEGDPARDEPARVVSPAYQDVQPHVVDGKVCALLTGQSTPHHFSAVVSTWSEGRSVVIDVDIADRCRSTIEFLAATYLVLLGSSDLVDAGPEHMIWEGRALGGGRLEFATRGVADVALAEAGRQKTRVQALARLDASTHTQRLFYSWRWTPAAGS